MMINLARWLQGHDELRVPEPKSFDSFRHTLVLGGLPGCKLKSTVHTPGAKDAFQRAGRALAVLHTHCNPEAPSRTLADHMARRRRALSVLLRFMPERATQLDDIGRRLDALAPKGRDNPVGFAHGDFHCGQVLVAAEGIGFVDFERAHHGPVLFDLGNWLAACHCHRIEGKWTDDGTLTQFFLEGYTGVRRGRLAAKAIAWWTALALLSMAPKPWRRLDADAPAKVAALLDQVCDLLRAA
jgi:Ser/Thr protein kinase RdoA (MazF antagonist)